jgi:hypothetical protein
MNGINLLNYKQMTLGKLSHTKTKRSRLINRVFDRWSAKVDKVGGWGSRDLTAADFDNQHSNRRQFNNEIRDNYLQQRQDGNRGSYQQKDGYQQQGRGKGRGGYQNRAGYQGRGGFQQQSQNRSYHQRQNRDDYQQRRNQERSWNNSNTTNVDTSNNAWGSKTSSNAAATAPAWDTVNGSTSISSWGDVSTSDSNASWGRNGVGAAELTDWNDNAKVQAAAVPTVPAVPMPNSWNASPSQHSSNLWSSKDSAPAPPTPTENSAPVSDGWDSAPKSNIDGQWGAMTLDSLGWNDSGKSPKDVKEAGKGIWKNGVHELGDDNEEMKLKLFGTATDEETIHSGINFDKYENIPVETKGNNVPAGITEVEALKSRYERTLMPMYLIVFQLQIGQSST